MIAFIIAGGSGTRLWPLSTPDYPKHLLKLNGERTLVQTTLDRARKLTSDDSIYIMPEISHTKHVKQQLDDLEPSHIVAEPARRGTASCILLAMHHLQKQGVPADEPVAFLWGDHLIRDERGFVLTFKRAGQLAAKYEKVVFIGAEPTYPATGFGYMEHGDEFDHEPQTFDLVKFHEKPDKKTANQYVKSGRFFWNMGYLVTTRATFERDVQKYSPKYWQSYQSLVAAKDVTKAYLALESDAIDYAFSEKIKGALVIPGNFDWIDIGSFGELHAISLLDDQGNHVLGGNVALENVSNSYVRNDTGTPVAVIGVDNLVVVNTPNGILVTNKNFAQRVGDVSKRLNGN